MIFDKTECETANEFFEAAFLLKLHGHKEHSQKIMKQAYYQLLLWHNEFQKITGIEDVILSTRQQVISSKPRNPNHDETIRIAKATWEKYPGASKERLCKKLRDHFNGRVSVDSLNSWVKKANIQPPKPGVYTSFLLVI